MIDNLINIIRKLGIGDMNDRDRDLLYGFVPFALPPTCPVRAEYKIKTTFAPKPEV